MKRFKGVFTALVTPFDESDGINESSLRKIIRYSLNNGVSGFYVCGSTGEWPLLTVDERKRVLEIVKDEVKDSALIIVNVGCISTKFSVELAKHAESVGVSAVSSFPPIYYKFSFREIKQYYFDIADSVNVPLIVYYIPSFTNVEMNIDSLLELLEHKNIIGVKFTSMDLFILERLKSLTDKIIFNGFDEVFLAGLSLGADGMIGSTCNFAPEIVVSIYDSFKAGDLKTAYIYQQRLNKMIRDILEFGVIQAIKEILNLAGFNCGNPRKPLRTLTSDKRTKLLSLIKEWDIKLFS
ncbi:N-acetylneuraminate lyase [bacterium]|nr:N-acetylneuraminate lyase [bacterium]